MGFFDWFKSGTEKMREKIIFSQKSRITSLEREVLNLRGDVLKREDELNRVRESHDQGKERLVDQIIQLSDKFSEINQRMLDIAHENTRLKLLVEGRPKTKAKRKK